MTPSCPVVSSQKLEQFGLVLRVFGCAGWAETGLGLRARGLGLDPNPSLFTSLPAVETSISVVVFITVSFTSGVHSAALFAKDLNESRMSVLAAQIPHLFTHFWQEIPPHIAGLLGQNIVVTLIGVCDAILYRTILKAILPTPIQVCSLPFTRNFSFFSPISPQLDVSGERAQDNQEVRRRRRREPAVLAQECPGQSQLCQDEA